MGGSQSLEGAWPDPGRGPAGPGGAGRAPRPWKAGQSHSPALLLAAHRCGAFYNLPGERSSLRKVCHKDVCRCAEGEMGRGNPSLGAQETSATSWLSSALRVVTETGTEILALRPCQRPRGRHTSGQVTEDGEFQDSLGYIYIHGETLSQEKQREREGRWETRTQMGTGI
jgi:hypothetical protein